MTGQTPIMGWTIPVSGDPIATAPGDIAQGLKDIENTLILPQDSRVPADGQDKYPQGPSLMPVTTAQPWPFATNGAVFTLKQGTVLYQFLLSGGNLVRPIVKFRTMSLVGQGPWIPVASVGSPSAQATGQVTINGNSGVRQAIVMLPANRFTSTPRVAVWNNNSSRPDIQTSCSMSDASATQFTAYVNRLDTLGASVGWSAIEGVE